MPKSENALVVSPRSAVVGTRRSRLIAALVNLAPVAIECFTTLARKWLVPTEQQINGQGSRPEKSNMADSSLGQSRGQGRRWRGRLRQNQ